VNVLNPFTLQRHPDTVLRGAFFEHCPNGLVVATGAAASNPSMLVYGKALTSNGESNVDTFARHGILQI
jgi:hypothetical protein